MKVVFMGTPDFAVPCLDSLVTNGHEVVLCVTQPDKPKGRSQTLTPPPVKVRAMELDIPVFQPKSMKTEESERTLKEANADIFIVVAFGKILPQNILDIPKYGCINIHASLLPKYRGAAPIQWAIAGGESVSGVTSMQMDAGLDTGDMLIKAEIEITKDETGETLHDKLSVLGSEVLIKTLASIEDGTIKREKQDDSLSNYAPMITKENTRIDFTKPAKDIHNLIRAMNPFPGAYCEYDGKKLKIFETELIDKTNGNAGEIVDVTDKDFTVSCSIGAIRVLSLQLEGKKRMPCADFLKGKKLSKCEILR